MLSRAQEARVRAILWSSPPGAIQTYCLEHLATAAKISSGHLSDLAIFARTLHERGDCQRRFGGFCDADRHETRQTLVWGPPEMMDRRAFIGTLAGGLFTAPLAEGAERTDAMPIIGFLEAASPSLVQPMREAFRQGLREHGWVENRNVRIEYRSAEGRNERFPEMAAEMVRLNVNVMVVTGEPMIIAAKRATSTIPIVMAAVGDPVGRGFVASLAHPGGNITGVSNVAVDLTGKWVELLKEAVPGLTKVAVLWNPTNPSHAALWREAQDAAHAHNLQVMDAPAKIAEDIEPAFSAIAKGRPDALIVLPDPLFNGQRVQIASLANRQRLPSVTLFKARGTTISYGPSLEENYRRAAAYVDKILRGTKPGDIPVEQPTKFELVIDLKTAKALGLTIPPSLLQRADQVIE